MEENMSPETIWYLKQIIAKGEKGLAEGRFYIHEQVKNLLKVRMQKYKMAGVKIQQKKLD